jgi:NAD(P)-dependent dehydrogenase (short-subunit alcohol dehydrogenase family)
MMAEQMQFSGKIVLITGAGRGVGREAAHAFARRGALLALNDITPINLDITIEQIKAMGVEVKDYVADISKKMQAQAMLDQILQDWDRIDILVNCASVCPKISLLETDEWDWRRTIDVNLGGSFIMTQLVGRVMRVQNGGTIVNLAGCDDEIKASYGYSAFMSSKTGVIGLTKVSAQELAEYAIRVNAICLSGNIKSAMDNSSRRFAESIEESSQKPRQESELVGAILFVCSSAGQDLNGQIIDASQMKRLL